MRRLVMMGMVVAVLLALGAPAQCASWQEVLSGQTYPLELQLGSLDGTWRRVSAEVPSATIGASTIYAAMFGLGAGLYYTRGETAEVGGETYLIAYVRQTKPVDMLAAMRSGEPPMPEKMTPETPLSLSVLHVRTIGGLTDIRVFDLAREIAESEAAQPGAEETEVKQESLSNLKNAAMALQMFLADYGEVLPDMRDMVTVMEALEEYVRDESVFFHPETGEAYGVNASLSGKKLQDAGDPARTVVFYEVEADSEGYRGVALLDGHAERVREVQWQELKEGSGIP